MARPLRLELPDGRYHVTSRGNERRSVFRSDRDREHFLDLLAELPVRFGTRLHAHVLMDNHYHLMLETPEANLSRAMHWLNLTYASWFNVRHRRVGHLWQGRFKGVLIEDDAGWQAVGRYVHLNPVRVRGLGLGKSARSSQRAGVSGAPSAEMVRQRLEILRTYPWSSYRAYAGYEAVPAWLFTEVLGGLGGGRTEVQRRAALRSYTEGAVREGLPESPWEGLQGGVVLGTEAYARRALQTARRDLREQPSARKLAGGVKWEAIVAAIEEEKGERWDVFCDRYGDWGRDVAFWLGRTLGRQRLSALAAFGGGVHYATVGAAVSRVRRRLGEDREFAAWVERIRSQLSKFEI